MEIYLKKLIHNILEHKEDFNYVEKYIKEKQKEFNEEFVSYWILRENELDLYKKLYDKNLINLYNKKDDLLYAVKEDMFDIVELILNDCNFKKRILECKNNEVVYSSYGFIINSTNMFDLIYNCEIVKDSEEEKYDILKNLSHHHNQKIIKHAIKNYPEISVSQQYVKYIFDYCPNVLNKLIFSPHFEISRLDTKENNYLIRQSFILDFNLFKKLLDKKMITEHTYFMFKENKGIIDKYRERIYLSLENEHFLNNLKQSTIKQSKCERLKKKALALKKSKNIDKF